MYSLISELQRLSFFIQYGRKYVVEHFGYTEKEKKKRTHPPPIT